MQTQEIKMRLCKKKRSFRSIADFHFKAVCLSFASAGILRRNRAFVFIAVSGLILRRPNRPHIQRSLRRECGEKQRWAKTKKNIQHHAIRMWSPTILLNGR
ncbi:hypothetical protein M011DRAFT_229078 [Sporormia fimetaria CBS 119925]|uniref:Uncharacterized protein n=1 Tax=Sporormia fimetaria CBS 119925 TaxID=1340428 RepID=A0A6A6VJS9_9PLEO|nr:hypothetical protein M011DRAFT_229078 [Sporormia fimetaria CBS 119925]